MDIPKAGQNQVDVGCVMPYKKKSMHSKLAGSKLDNALGLCRLVTLHSGVDVFRIQMVGTSGRSRVAREMHSMPRNSS